MKTKKICVTAMGVALYVVLALCLQVPVFENYYLCLGYVAMAVYCCHFGAVSGMTVGTMGVVLYCLLTNGLRGMPGWAAGNLVIGLLLGLACRKTASMENKPLRQMILVAVIVLATAVGILGVKSLVEVILYAQPMLVRVVKNSYAFVADVVVLTVGILLCPGVTPAIRKLFPELMIS